MDAASDELADLDGLSVAEPKALLREQHVALQERDAALQEQRAALQEQRAALQEKHAQLVAKDTLLRSYALEIEALKLQSHCSHARRSIAPWNSLALSR
jgi:DNA-binding transcriptional MerR regulator